MIPTLPYLDPDPAARAAGLAAVRAELEYAFDRPAGIAMARSVPSRLGFPLAVLAQVAEAEAVLAANRAANRVARGLAPEPERSSVASCSALFRTVERPPVLSRLGTAGMGAPPADRAFAWQRVAGACPFVIEARAELGDHVALDGATYAGAIAGDTLEAALAERRLMVADYAMLDGLPAGQRRFLSAPIAIFALPRGGAEIVPVAIQLGQRRDRIVTPAHGIGWQMARVAVQVADANVQESFHHLGRAHFLIEAFAMALERQVSDRHPLHVLLAPHVRGTLAINGAAREKLVVPGGQLEQLLAPTLAGSLDLCRRALATWRLADATLEGDLRARGVGDREVLPEYPYRDDARLIERAIAEWVESALRIAYGSDAEVAADPELRAFLGELRSPEGGRLPSVPVVETVAALVELVTYVVFTTSAYHASLNYTQGDFMGWVPGMPTAAYADASEIDTGTDEEAWARVLPPPATAAAQLDFMVQQSRVRADRLGDYPMMWFRDPRLSEPLARFRAALDEARTVIEARDRARFLPYPYLCPPNLTASIHI